MPKIRMNPIFYFILGMFQAATAWATLPGTLPLWDGYVAFEVEPQDGLGELRGADVYHLAMPDTEESRGLVDLLTESEGEPIRFRDIIHFLESEGTEVFAKSRQSQQLAKSLAHDFSFERFFGGRTEKSISSSRSLAPEIYLLANGKLIKAFTIESKSYPGGENINSQQLRKLLMEDPKVFGRLLWLTGDGNLYPYQKTAYQKRLLKNTGFLSHIIQTELPDRTKLLSKLRRARTLNRRLSTTAIENKEDGVRHFWETLKSKLDAGEYSWLKFYLSTIPENGEDPARSLEKMAEFVAGSPELIESMDHLLELQRRYLSVIKDNPDRYSETKLEQIKARLRNASVVLFTVVATGATISNPSVKWPAFATFWWDMWFGFEIKGDLKLQEKLEKDLGDIEKYFSGLNAHLAQGYDSPLEPGYSSTNLKLETQYSRSEQDLLMRNTGDAEAIGELVEFISGLSNKALPEPQLERFRYRKSTALLRFLRRYARIGTEKMTEFSNHKKQNAEDFERLGHSFYLLSLVHKAARQMIEIDHKLENDQLIPRTVFRPRIVYRKPPKPESQIPSLREVAEEAQGTL